MQVFKVLQNEHLTKTKCELRLKFPVSGSFLQVSNQEWPAKFFEAR